MEPLQKKLTRKALEAQKELDSKYFPALAKELFEYYVIQKGNIQYKFTEIEFYLYHDKRRDIISYPRNTKAGEWFFHASGVDIAFESHVEVKEGVKKPVLTKDAFFGGILIRGIERIVSEGKNIPFKGPMLSCEELFDKFDAFGEAENFPKLVRLSEAMPYEYKKPINRYGLKENAEEKVSSILSNNYSDIDGIEKKDLIQAYSDYRLEGYRYLR